MRRDTWDMIDVILNRLNELEEQTEKHGLLLDSILGWVKAYDKEGNTALPRLAQIEIQKRLDELVDKHEKEK